MSERERERGKKHHDVPPSQGNAVRSGRLQVRSEECLRADPDQRKRREPYSGRIRSTHRAGRERDVRAGRNEREVAEPEVRTHSPYERSAAEAAKNEPQTGGERNEGKGRPSRSVR